MLISFKEVKSSYFRRHHHLLKVHRQHHNFFSRSHRSWVTEHTRVCVETLYCPIVPNSETLRKM